MDVNIMIDLKDISFGYSSESLILNKLNFKLFKGSRIGLTGSNGSGKTTLLHIIMGLVKPLSGRLKIFDRQVNEEKDFLPVRRKIGLLFQDADDQLFSPTVLEDVAFGPLNLGKTREEAIEISLKTLEYLGLKGFEEKITFKLSGGEKRLVSLATVLAMKPKILLLDEPTTGLDDKTKSRLMEVLLNLDLSYIIISHEIDFLLKTTDHIYALKNGKTSLKTDLHTHIHSHPHINHKRTV